MSKRYSTMTIESVIDKEEIIDFLEDYDIDLSDEQQSGLSDWGYSFEIDTDEMIDRLEEMDYIVKDTDVATKQDWISVFSSDVYNRNKAIAESIAETIHKCDDSPMLIREIIAELTNSPACADGKELCDNLLKMIN